MKLRAKELNRRYVLDSLVIPKGVLVVARLDLLFLYYSRSKGSGIKIPVMEQPQNNVVNDCPICSWFFCC